MFTQEELLASYPEPLAISAEQVRHAIAARHSPEPIFVVLDDDPTGTQSVADLPVLMAWDVEDFLWALSQGAPAVYVMTNSRSLSPEDAKTVTREAVSHALKAAQELGVSVAFTTRSDSTLRGHFPLEPDTIADVLSEHGHSIDGIILVPAFPEAGRITVHGRHYTRHGDSFIPVEHSEFASDATFGFAHGRLDEWVEEKTEGSIDASSVSTPCLATLRAEGSALRGELMNLSQGTVCAPDIACEEDLRALALALIQAEDAGKSFIYRVGPPFMRARLGQESRPPLTPQEIEALRHLEEGDSRPTMPGGLIAVGSHVGLTTSQLTDLRANVDLSQFEIDVATVINPATRAAHLDKIVSSIVEALASGSVVVSTSRRLITGADGDASLDISRRVSDAVVEVVHRVVEEVRPRFVVAKGGITSSDVAARGLDIRHARCIGSMLPGLVSLWAAQDGLTQGIPYVVFPGNVGNAHSLTDVVHTLES